MFYSYLLQNGREAVPKHHTTTRTHEFAVTPGLMLCVGIIKVNCDTCAIGDFHDTRGHEVFDVERYSSFCDSLVPLCNSISRQQTDSIVVQIRTYDYRDDIGGRLSPPEKSGASCTTMDLLQNHRQKKQSKMYQQRRNGSRKL